MASDRHALVLGGGFTGMLAAAVLARHFAAVTVVDRDRLPAEPVNRAGVPQAHHGHLLVAQGARLLDSLLPGVVGELTEAGARRIRIPTDLVSLTSQGWLPRLPELQFGISCSRALLDWVIRTRVLADHRIRLVEATEVESLYGDAGRVRGARGRSRETAEAIEFEADLVVDATGRASRAPDWLTALGLPAVRDEVVDCGLGYATGLFRAPEQAGPDFPLVAVQGAPTKVRPGSAGVLFPIEHGQWMVTLSGIREGRPPTDEDGFARFAANLRHGVVGDLVRAAEPLGRPRGYHHTANRRRRYDRLSRWPAGFFVLGDALVTTNPTYAHGMTTSAGSVAALAAALDRGDLDLRDPLQLQRDIAATAKVAWQMATMSDALYLERGASRLLARLQQPMMNRLQAAALGNPLVLAVLLDTFTLSGSFAGLLRPRVALGVLAGGSGPGRDDPPFTDRERAVFDGARTGGDRLDR